MNENNLNNNTSNGDANNRREKYIEQQFGAPNESKEDYSQVTLSQLEELRNTIKKQIIKIIVVVVSIIVAFLILTQGVFIGLLPFGIVFIAILTVMIPAKNKLKFNNAYKHYFVRKSLETIFTDLYYSPYSGISRDIISNTEMMDTGDIYSSNDYVEGKYKGILFRQSDVHIENESTDSDGNTTYTTVFKGRWMIFDFNKPFKANVEVAQKNFGGNRVKFSFNKEEKYKRVKLESEDFNKRFKVYAQNELEAFYILTPHTMEKIIRLDEANTGKLLLCFYNNELHVGVYDDKDSFEYTNYFKPIDEQKELDKISKDIKLITMFIDELSLDNDLFRREV